MFQRVCVMALIRFRHASQLAVNSPIHSRGFTMAEVLVASVITGVALLLGGTTLTSALTSTETVNAENERQAELSRALNFIWQEVLESRNINQGPLPSFSYPTTVKSGTGQPVLWLTLANGAPIVYYSAVPADGEPWRQPRAIYRWGPRFNANGTYENIDAPSTWVHQILVDSVAPSPVPATPCPSGWNVFPPLPSASAPAPATGFYACVDSTHRFANLVQVGHVSKPLGGGEEYTVDQQAYSRSTKVSPPTVTRSLPTDLTVDGPEILRKSKITLTPFGGEIQCGPGGVKLETETTVIWTIPNVSGPPKKEEDVIRSGSLTKEVPKGTSIRLVGRLIPDSSCPSMKDWGVPEADSNRDRNTQVMTLVNNSPVPDIKPFAGQKTIAEMSKPVFDPVTNTVKIGDQQILFLFEVGVPYAKRSEPAYDLQDIVILADVVPQDMP